LSARDTFAFLDEKIAYDLDHWQRAGSVLPYNTVHVIKNSRVMPPH